MGLACFEILYCIRYKGLSMTTKRLIQDSQFRLRYEVDTTVECYALDRNC
jgi:hypothetical protein